MRHVLASVAAIVNSLLLAFTSYAAPDPWQEHAGSPLLADVQPVSLSFVREITGGDDPLQMPAGVAVGPDGTLYVIDTARDHIRVFDSEGNPVGTWGELGGDPGQFRFSLFKDYGAAGDLAVRPDGSIYVADTFNNRIQKLAADGTFILAWGEGGDEPGQIFEPSGIGVDAAGHVYVAEATGVQVFDADGQFLDSWDGAQGDGPPLAGPADVAIDGEGVVWVTDNGLHRVVSFGNDGTVLQAFGAIGDATGELNGPQGLAIDTGGNAFVAEAGGDRVQLFAPDGTSLGIVPDTTSSSTAFSTPTFIVLGPDGALYVADTGNHRVLMFSSNAAGTPTP
jgi:tripartite motif-containing protein 71